MILVNDSGFRYRSGMGQQPLFQQSDLFMLGVTAVLIFWGFSVIRKK